MELLLIFIPIVLVLISQAIVNATYSKYKSYKTSNNVTGFDTARQILDYNGLNNVKILETREKLGDHFDPRTGVIKLSTEVYNGNSIASVSIAAHECGHAIQHKEKYAPIIIRSALVPLVGFASKIGYIMLIIGLISELFNLAIIGLILMGASLIFQFITLPVEFDASKRAKDILIKRNIVEKNEINGVNKVLKAAAFTYLASFFATMLQMLRLFLIVNNGRRD